MHPFYEQNSRFLRGIKQSSDQEKNWWVGIASMAMYLSFWTAALVIVARMAKKYIPDAERARDEKDPAIAIARKRYARGKIDAKEFRKRMSELR